MSGHGGGHGGGKARGGGDHEEGHEGADERWLLSYADFITLLLALFMVLFALSTVNRNKFAEFRTGLVSAFDSSANASPTVPGGTGLLQESSLVKSAGASKQLKETKPAPVSDSVSAGTAKAAKKIQAKLLAKGLAGDVHIEQTARGLVIQLLTDKVFFSSGSAGLAGQGATVIDTVGEALNQLPNDISVEGHTDNQPISSAQFPTNWELSTTRADTVLRRLTEHDGVDAAHLQAIGYADTRPIAADDTVANRARNRRVEIVVLTDQSATAATTGTGTTTAADGSAAAATAATTGGT
ncbi:flagellar motor protein MotB [Acidothermaceae bacterium B102]|nr:flagellar motor protein MotB [Acidothermaceae bacterium B102]